MDTKVYKWTVPVVTQAELGLYICLGREIFENT